MYKNSIWIALYTGVWVYHDVLTSYIKIKNEQKKQMSKKRWFSDNKIRKKTLLVIIWGFSFWYRLKWTKPLCRHRCVYVLTHCMCVCVQFRTDSLLIINILLPYKGTASDRCTLSRTKFHTICKRREEKSFFSAWCPFNSCVMIWFWNTHSLVCVYNYNYIKKNLIVQCAFRTCFAFTYRHMMHTPNNKTKSTAYGTIQKNNAANTVYSNISFYQTRQ